MLSGLDAKWVDGSKNDLPNNDLTRKETENENVKITAKRDKNDDDDDDDDDDNDDDDNKNKTIGKNEGQIKLKLKKLDDDEVENDYEKYQNIKSSQPVQFDNSTESVINSTETEEFDKKIEITKLELNCTRNDTNVLDKVSYPKHHHIHNHHKFDQNKTNNLTQHRLFHHYHRLPINSNETIIFRSPHKDTFRKQNCSCSSLIRLIQRPRSEIKIIFKKEKNQNVSLAVENILNDARKVSVKNVYENVISILEGVSNTINSLNVEKFDKATLKLNSSLNLNNSSEINEIEMDLINSVENASRAVHLAKESIQNALDSLRNSTNLDNFEEELNENKTVNVSVTTENSIATLKVEEHFKIDEIDKNTTETMETTTTMDNLTTINEFENTTDIQNTSSVTLANINETTEPTTQSSLDNIIFSNTTQTESSTILTTI